jgi:hypothetical protein
MLAARGIETKPRRLAGYLDLFATERVLVGITAVVTPTMNGVSLEVNKRSLS